MEQPTQHGRATYAGFTDYVFLNSGILKVNVIPAPIYPLLVIIMLLLDGYLALLVFGTAGGQGAYPWIVKVVLPFLLPYFALLVIGQRKRNRLYASIPVLESTKSRTGKLIPWSEVRSIRVGDAGLFYVTTPNRVYTMWALERKRNSIIEFAESATGRDLLLKSSSLS
jgi:hypothetical protein